ncbi:methyltransferase-like protein 4 [Poecilia reticulata]|uniref:methyltransferase-like protein 4 n=1 Tax=Poecilia reticulata TaxID=8081 RepID=UPI0004A408A3|nr:PREDICTED: methyltransferase-like protein 4 [Poecilia reticulata]
MSVVLQSNSGWVLDSQSLIDRGYARCITWTGHHKSHVKCNFKRQCFHILKSHYDMSGRVDGGHTVMTQKTEKAAKKRKRKHGELNQGEIDAKAFHEKIRSVILEGTKSLVDSAQSLGYLSGETETSKDPLPSQDCRLAALCEMAKELPLVAEEEQEWTQSLLTEEGGASHVDLFSQVTENSEAWAAVVPLMGEEYIIPHNTAFLLSDFTRIQPLVQCECNEKKKEYSSLPSSQLKRLPVPLLGSPGCLVVTWVTNRPSHLRFVRDELYPHWGVEVVAEWFWVKVTTSGEFVFPLDSPHKKPYEVLVLGRYRPANDHTSPLQTANVPVEDKRLIVSVPSALHSQKPSLSEVLKLYVGAEAKCLELFARSLQPGWTSWGNEVLKFQHISYFDLEPADTSKAEATEDAADNPAET